MNVNIPNKKFVNSQIEGFRTFLDKRFQDAIDSREAKALRYQKGYRYYLALEPVQGANELSGYVEPIVRKAVDKVMPSLLNIFTENEEQAVIFRPQRTSLPVQVIDSVNRKINDIFLRENNGYNLLTQAIREALCTGDAFLKVFIEEETVEEEINGDDMPMPIEMVLMLVGNDFPDTDINKMQIKTEKMKDPQTGEDIEVPMLEGTLVLKRIERKQCVNFVSFDELYPLADTADLRDTRYICHKIKKSVGDLVAMGFDKETVLGAKIEEDEGSDLSTMDMINNGVNKKIEENDLIDPMEREVSLYEHYIYSSMLDKKSETKLYQVFAINRDEILEINEVARIPFVKGVPESIPGSFWGTGFADTLAQYQDYASGIIRDIYQRGKQNTYPRWMALKDGYDRQSLLNSSRPGAVVEISQPGALSPLPVHQVAPELQGMLTLIQQSAGEEMMNAVGGSVDPATINNIAASTMSMAIHNAEMKDKKIAKSLAYTMIRPLFELMYNSIRDENLTVEVDTPEGPQPFQGSQLPERSEFYIDVNTANDDAMQAQQLNNVAQMVGQLSQMPSSVMTPENLYNLASAILKASDINEVDMYLSNPAMNQPSPEEMAMQQQQAMEAQQRQNDLMDAQVGVAVAQQAKLEVETSELIKDGDAKRKLEEQKMLLEMERLEIERFAEDKQAEYNLGKVEVKRDELNAEIQTGRKIGLTQ